MVWKELWKMAWEAWRGKMRKEFNTEGYIMAPEHKPGV